MKLLTSTLVARFATVGRQEHVEDPIVIAKFFHPFGRMTWYATEYDAAERVFFGWVENGPDSELGYFALDELEEVRVHGLGMERDLHFAERPLSAVKAEVGR
jgi:Protein of unknown function (DUF2958)